jgi:WD40 repeat protein
VELMLNQWQYLTRPSEWDPTIAWSPDGRVLACATTNGNIDLWDIREHRLWGSLPANEPVQVDLLAFSPDGHTLAGAFDFSMSEPIRFWDIATGLRWQTSGEHEDHVHEITFSPDGAILASAAGEVKLWSSGTGEQLSVLDGLTTVAFSPDGTRLASRFQGGPVANQYGAIKIWDIGSAEVKLILEGHLANVEQVLFSEDSRLIIARGTLPPVLKVRVPTEAINIWDASTGEELCYCAIEGSLNAILLYPNSDLFLSTGRTSQNKSGHPVTELALWDTQTCRQLCRTSINVERIGSLALSPDGSLLATSIKGAVLLWQIET